MEAPDIYLFLGFIKKSHFCFCFFDNLGTVKLPFYNQWKRKNRPQTRMISKKH